MRMSLGRMKGLATAQNGAKVGAKLFWKNSNPNFVLKC